MNGGDRRHVETFATQHPDTLVARVWRELLYVEQLLDAVTRYHPKFEDYRKTMEWKRKYGDEE